MKILTVLSILMTTLVGHTSSAAEPVSKRILTLAYELENLTNNIEYDASKSNSPMSSYCYGAGIMAEKGNDAMFLAISLNQLPSDASTKFKIDTLSEIHTRVFNMRELCDAKEANANLEYTLPNIKNEMDLIGKLAQRIDR